MAVLLALDGVEKTTARTARNKTAKPNDKAGASEVASAFSRISGAGKREGELQRDGHIGRFGRATKLRHQEDQAAGG